MYREKETYIGKTVGDNIIGFKSMAIVDDTFNVTFFKCGLKKKCLNKPFLEINVRMKLKSSNEQEIYENYFHKKG